MRSLISNRTNPNDLGYRQDRRVVGVMNEVLTALRVGFSFSRRGDEALAGYRAWFKRLLPALFAQAAAVPAAQFADCRWAATSMSRTLGSFGTQGRIGRHSKHGVRQATVRKS
ncbi:MAG TPA: hypothetical protein VMV69_13190 [Pirellulales bacterium]|nr:hypothetical protein [Pirellulales bacterium]